MLAAFYAHTLRMIGPPQDTRRAEIVGGTGLGELKQWVAPEKGL